MKRNMLRELLNAGKPTLSTRMLTTSPQTVEIIGYSRAFDFIELLGDYASWTVTDLDNFARTVELFPQMSSMLKVEREPRMFIAQRALGSGIQNLLFADCDSAAEVEECIRYVRPATPKDAGLHGSSMRRNVGYVLEDGSQEWAQAMRNVVVEVMIESAKAFEQLDEILSVKGLDMVHFGPSDYSLSTGKVGQKTSPETKSKNRLVIESALRKSIRPRIVINSYEEAKEYVEMGVRDFCVGNDLGILYQWCSLNGRKMRELLGGP
jgi:2-keto-3-deoxy-L-rhamnonate aldolase RhmA